MMMMILLSKYQQLNAFKIIGFNVWCTIHFLFEYINIKLIYIRDFNTKIIKFKSLIYISFKLIAKLDG